MIPHRHHFFLARKGIKSWGKQTVQSESISFWISDILIARIQKLVSKSKQREPKCQRLKALPRNTEGMH